MTFATDTLALLRRLAQRHAPPPVAALHLPPPSADGSKDGEFCAVALADGSLGLSYVLLDDTLAALRRQGGGALAGLPALALAEDYGRATGARRTLGFAAVNALTRWLFSRAGFQPPPAGGSLGDLALQAGDHLGMVGLFPALVPQALAAGARLTVLELRAELAGPRAGYTVTLERQALAACNKVLTTSTLLLNDTLDDTLAPLRGASHIAMVGPGAGCLPDALFARGVTLLGGSWVREPGAFVDALRAGRPWGPHVVKTALTPAGYPGFDTLLARL